MIAVPCESVPTKQAFYRNRPCPNLPPEYSAVQDELPCYSCDLHREGYVYLKKEWLGKGLRSPDRRWMFCYFVLQGTALNIYAADPNHCHPSIPPRHPISSWNLAALEAKEAVQYFKYPNTFRVHHADGSTHLVRFKDHHRYRAWLKDLQFSSRLSLDIDLRPTTPY
ncbi:hypothetical protein DSO57_1016085 [Entomophthora muscae]|uniref:Uncharacterized protein n=1 Tax=Entomophthora muscae TaxID=34485 RepID=A0ACC2RWD6_9FUNG|nr:hypothetical protein DSO57_1016085 [Entomophthora muscae]